MNHFKDALNTTLVALTGLCVGLANELKRVGWPTVKSTGLSQMNQGSILVQKDTCIADASISFIRKSDISGALDYTPVFFLSLYFDEHLSIFTGELLPAFYEKKSIPCVGAGWPGIGIPGHEPARFR